MELTNEEIAKVFAMYLPCEIIHKDTKETATLIGVEANDCSHIHEETNQYGSSLVSANLISLTPHSKISNEHAVEVAKLTPCDGGHGNNGRWKTDYDYCMHNGYTPEQFGNRLRLQKLSNIELSTRLFTKSILNNVFVYQQLILWRYAVPLYFGVNHWANGKDAIQLGLAIDATTLPIQNKS